MKTKHGVFSGIVVMMITAMITLAGCGDADGGPLGNPNPPGDTNPTVNSVTVTPATPTVAKGGTQTFAASVTGTNNPAQTVTWTVSGNSEAGTAINNGVLIVDIDEADGTLTVTATSTVDTSKSGYATVTISGTATVASVTVSPATVDVAKGGTQTFTASVAGTSNPAQTVTWSVTGGGGGTTITAGGVLTVAADETVATSLTVTATSTVDPSKFGTATVTVTGPGLYVGTETTPQAGTETLATALAWLGSNAENSTSYTIKLGADESLAPKTLNSSNINSKTNVSITLTTVDSTPRTVQLSSQGSLFTITESTVTLILDGYVVIRGRADNNTALIRVSGGTLELKENAKITGNTSSATSDSGGGVQVNGGTFTMFGGEISGNHVTSEGGGGVRISTTSSSITSTFTMSDGTITGNSATHGGGVFVHSHTGGSTSTFTMSGGTITGNTAHLGGAAGNVGGGVFINGENGTDTFNISGNAVISGNTAGVGGGVGILQASLNKTGGSITGNTASGIPDMAPAGIGNTVLAMSGESADDIAGYLNDDAGTGYNITATWNGSSYTATTGLNEFQL